MRAPFFAFDQSGETDYENKKEPDTAGAESGVRRLYI